MSVLTMRPPLRPAQRYQLDTAVKELTVAERLARGTHQNERDHQALVAAVKSGRITAEEGL